MGRGTLDNEIYIGVMKIKREKTVLKLSKRKIEFISYATLLFSVQALASFFVRDSGGIGNWLNLKLNETFGIAKYPFVLILLIHSSMMLKVKRQSFYSKLNYVLCSLFLVQGILYLAGVNGGEIGYFIASVSSRAFGSYMAVIFLYMVLIYLLSRLTGKYVSDMKFTIFEDIPAAKSEIDSSEVNLDSMYDIPVNTENQKFDIDKINWSKRNPGKDFAVVAKTEEFEERGRFEIPIGTDENGVVVYENITKFPHSLTGGTTDSGKSMLINSIICSLLLKNHPDEVKFILIDAKDGVELSFYNGLKHLMHPVIEDRETAIQVLKTVREECRHRNELFKKNSVKNINGYNEKNGTQMCRVFVVIEELAELLTGENVKSKKEDSVTSLLSRLAATARNCGVHLIISTQNPVAETVHTDIKNNVSARFGMSVASDSASRVILGINGAENLIKYGDMLVKTDSKPMYRAQGLNIPDAVILGIVESVKERYGFNESEADYFSETYIPVEDVSWISEKAEMVLLKAIEFGSISISMVQKWLGVRFNAAKPIYNEIEQLGIILPSNGNEARKLKINSFEEWEEFKKGFS